MSTNFTKSALLATTLLGGIAISNPAFAQDASAPAPGTQPPVAVDEPVTGNETPQETNETAQNAATDEGEIIVTGSRIARPNLQANSPIAVLSSDVFEQTGELTVENVVNTLPQFTPFTTAASNNPGGGQANLDLRGLGPNRTLVLVNGRRFIGAAQDQVVDVNVIPAELIDRVDVVTGGASAVYGADAVAGVVNFVMKRDFEGLRISANSGISQEGDGEEYGVGVTVGSNLADGRGNITLHGSWARREGVLANKRDFNRIDVTGLSDVAQLNGQFIQGGSSRGTSGSIVNNPANPTPRQPVTATLINGQNCGDVLEEQIGFNAAGNRVIAFLPNGQPTGFCPVSDAFGGNRYNFAPVNFIQVPLERYLTAAYGSYEVSDRINAFADFTYASTEVSNQLAPSPLAASENVTIDPNSPLLTPATRAILALRGDPLAPAAVERRMAELGARVQTFDTDLFQGTFGFNGKLVNDWRWEAYGQFGRTKIDTLTLNDLSTSRLQAALNGCPAGAPAGCAAAGSFSNFFGGDLTQAQVDYLIYPTLTDRLTVQRKVVNVNVTGDLFQLPAGGLGFSAGAEYRQEKSNSVPDAAKQADDIVGFNAADPIKGKYDVKELFAEAIVPILQDQPFANSLEVELGARYSDYSTVGGVWTYKAGGTFAPVAGFRLRGLYQRATRAPNVFELFRAADQDFPVVFDPCDARFFGGDPAVGARCLASGVDPDAFIASNLQVEATRVGNPGLSEEKADTITLGAVFEGRRFESIPVLNQITASVDYYKIDIKDAILAQYAGAQSLVNACFENGDPQACSQLSRSPSGDVIIDEIGFENLANFKVKGIDMSVDFRQPLGSFGTFNIDVNATRLIDFIIEDPIRGKADGAGYYSDFGFLPKWRGSARFSLNSGPWTGVLAARYIGKYKGSFSRFDPDEDANAGSGFEFEYPNYKVPDATYLDAALSFDLTERYRFGVAVENLTNRNPIPLFDLSEQSNTNPNAYDLIGRTYRFSVSAKF